MSAGPPKGVEPSELWQKLSERPRPTATIDFPSKDADKSPGKLAIRVLTESELHSCRANADKAAKEFIGADSKVGDLGYEDVYRNEIAVQLVCMACRNVDDPNFPAFVSPKHARQKMTTDEFAMLAAAYHHFRLESGPIIAEMTEGEMEAWIQVLQRGGSRLPLARLSGEALSDLVMFLVSRVATSPTASGSAGLPPEEPSTTASASELVDESEKSQS